MDTRSTRIKEIIAENLNISAEKITNELAVGDIPEWDSLAHVRIIGALELALGIELDIEETLELEDVFDLVEAFSKDT